MNTLPPRDVTAERHFVLRVSLIPPCHDIPHPCPPMTAADQAHEATWSRRTQSAFGEQSAGLNPPVTGGKHMGATAYCAWQALHKVPHVKPNCSPTLVTAEKPLRGLPLPTTLSVRIPHPSDQEHRRRGQVECGAEADGHSFLLE
ncbi:hypothetical protein AAFF_G00346440 [Aldrovandia affinis]|uniref:Uncharacterized protein n=1 Tax=Aldrovandia affinis TaxID=143900 RepID=A0AAD7SLR7_9TELE|nr:hypothetical protein AAFF_G00346440 [Aldrovandia affinis]